MFCSLAIFARRSPTGYAFLAGDELVDKDVSFNVTNQDSSSSSRSRAIARRWATLRR
jgi:hypothetical protein